MDAHGHGIAGDHSAAAGAMGAGIREIGYQGGAHPFAGHFHQPQICKIVNLVSGTVSAEAFFEPVQHLLFVAFVYHIDKIDDNHAAEIAEADLAGCLGCGFQVCAFHRFFIAGFAGKAAGIDIDCHQGFGLFYLDIATAGEVDAGVEDAFYLFFYAPGVEDGAVFTVQFHAGD